MSPVTPRPAVADALRRAAGGIWWYLRAVSGENRYDEHVERCRDRGLEPMSRRAFERHRADLREHQTVGRCC